MPTPISEAPQSEVFNRSNGGQLEKLPVTFQTAVKKLHKKDTKAKQNEEINSKLVKPTADNLIVGKPVGVTTSCL